MSIPNIIHLRPDRKLIDPKFDGYKLSLDPVPVIKTPITTPPRRCHTNEDQYSFLHAKLFSLHNLLVKDPWHSYSFYYLDSNWTVQNVKYDTNTGLIQPVRAVFKLPKPNTAIGDYNPSFNFISEKYCVFSDGCGMLRFIDTGDRYRVDEWKGIYADHVLGNDMRFIVQDSRLEFTDGNPEIHCLLLSVQINSVDKDQGFQAVLDWLVFKKLEGNANWSKVITKQLKGKSLPEFCYFEPKCKSILISTERKWDFTADSENEIAAKHSEEKAAIKNDEIVDNINTINFTWTQTDEDVLIHFNIPRDCNKNDVKVICNGTKIQVLHKNDNLLNAELLDRIDNDLTTWNLVCQILYILFMTHLQIIMLNFRLLIGK